MNMNSIDLQDTIPLSLYIHIPWCIKKCPYCDFNSHEMPKTLPEEQYIDALLSDLQSELPSIWGRRLHSIFIGGGTPSLFSANALNRLLKGIHILLPFSPTLEITLEANPGTFEQERFSAYRQLGINRLSIGVQSYNAKELKSLGRIHNHHDARQASRIAQQAGFDNINIDLMYGLPQQTTQQSLSNLQQAIDSQPQHISWYQLTLEPNTLFYHQQPTLPNDDVIADMHEEGIQLLKHNNFNQYEVSAYAQTDHQSQHNTNYWQFGDYIAIGAGAHGKITHHNEVIRYQKYRHPQDYIKQALMGKARTKTQTLSQDEIVFEFMLNALRLKEGVSTTLFQQRTKLTIQSLQQGFQKAYQQGLLHAITNNQQIITTKRGWQFLNETVECFL